MAGRWQFNLLRFQIPFDFREHTIGLPISFLHASHDQFNLTYLRTRKQAIAYINMMAIRGIIINGADHYTLLA